MLFFLWIFDEIFAYIFYLVESDKYRKTPGKTGGDKTIILRIESRGYPFQYHL